MMHLAMIMQADENIDRLAKGDAKAVKKLQGSRTSWVSNSAKTKTLTLASSSLALYKNRTLATAMK